MADTPFYERLLTAEPSVEIQAVLIVSNIVLWQLVFKATMYLIPRVLGGRPWFQQLSDEVWRQLPGPKGLESCPVKRGGFDTKYGYAEWVYGGLHHGLSGALILYSYLYPDGGVAFRHGTAIALGGMSPRRPMGLL